MRAVPLLLALAAAGCLRQTQFQCDTDTACGAGGACESDGFCSFVDSMCPSGRRYGDSAGGNAGKCTGGGGDLDGGIDGNRVDAATDGGQTVGCPSGYNPITGGQSGHLYKIVTAEANWDSQQASCRLNSLSAYLAIPDDAAELMALDAVAPGALYWVGIHDKDVENQWKNTLGAPQTYLPWQPPAPDNNAGGQGEDCVEAIAATHTINDERCAGGTNRPAICECSP